MHQRQPLNEVVLISGHGTPSDASDEQSVCHCSANTQDIQIEACSEKVTRSRKCSKRGQWPESKWRNLKGVASARCHQLQWFQGADVPLTPF